MLLNKKVIKKATKPKEIEEINWKEKLMKLKANI